MSDKMNVMIITIVFFVFFYFASGTLSLCVFTVKYTCDENNGFTFKAYGTSAVKKVYVKDKMDSCSTTVTTGANLRGFTASAGTSGSPTTGEITNSASDIAACGDEDVSWT